jgi:hypothetical protein
MPSALSRALDSAIDAWDYNANIPLPAQIPTDPQQFYRSFGYLEHPVTRAPVKELTPYQLAVWEALQTHKRVLAVKSNKVGLTTSTLLMDCQLAILPSSNPLSCRGYDQLVIAQTKDHAREHLRTLRKLLTNSKRYSPFLIDRPTEVSEEDPTAAMRAEQSKTSVIYLRNPDNERQPSRIIALGANSEGSILSWRNVKHVHISDITVAEVDYTGALNAAFTRLANTNGSMLIETIPNGAVGKIYEMYDNPGDFRTFSIPASEAVKAGIITAEFLAGEKQRLGPFYPQYYECAFLSPGNTWYDSDLFAFEDEDEDDGPEDWEVTTS